MKHLGRGIAVILLLLVAYTISYLALLDPQVTFGGTLRTTIYHRLVSFRVTGPSEFLEAFYQPLIELDQKIRPEYWTWFETSRGV